jgi:hypothetical protein
MRAGLFLIASEPVLLELDLQTSRPPPPLTVWHAAAGNIPPLAAHATPFSFPVAPATGPCPSPASQPAAPCLVHTTQAGDALRRPNGALQAHPLQLEPAAPCPIPASRAGSRRPTGFPRASILIEEEGHSASPGLVHASLPSYLQPRLSRLALLPSLITDSVSFVHVRSHSPCQKGLTSWLLRGSA